MRVHRQEHQLRPALALWMLVSITVAPWPATPVMGQHGGDTGIAPSQLLSRRWPVSLLSASLNIESPKPVPAEAVQPGPAIPDAPQSSDTLSLRRSQSRYRTMAVTGFVLASLSLLISAATLPVVLRNRELERDGGSVSCGPYFAPALTVPVFVAGVSVGLWGVLAGRRLRSAHPELGMPAATRGRRMSAILGTLFVVGAIGLAAPAFVCHS